MKQLTNRTFIVLLISIFFTGIVEAQELIELELTEAYKLAVTNYPKYQEGILFEEISQINLLLLNRNRLPVISVNAEGRIQSENVQIGNGDPSFPINVDVPLESYKAYVGFNVTLYDGGLTTAQKELEKSSEIANQKALNVQLRNLNDRINLVFFNIELARQQRKILDTSIQDIEANIGIGETRLIHGVILSSEINKLKVRRLELLSEQQKIEGDIEAFITVLEKLIGIPLSREIKLNFPSVASIPTELPINRPEQNLFEAQKEVLAAQKKVSGINTKPKIILFGEGGVGNPNPLNFTNTDPSLYGLMGVKLSWNFLDWGKTKQENEKINLQIRQSEIDKMTFEFDLLSRRQEFVQRVEALEKQLLNDHTIVNLQKEILMQSNNQLNSGIINSTEYLQQVNAELRARQQQKLHEIQLNQLKIEYLTLFGNL